MDEKTELEKQVKELRTQLAVADGKCEHWQNVATVQSGEQATNNANLQRLRELVGAFCELTDKICWAEPELSQYRAMRAELRELLAERSKQP